MLRHSNAGLLLVAVLLLAIQPPSVTAQPDLPHGDLLRLDWEGKHRSGESSAKGPEHGDFTPGSEHYDLLRSVLDLRLDLEEASLAGTVKHVFASLDDTLQTVVLDLADGFGLTVSTVTGTGGALSFLHADDALLVRLPAALPFGAVDSLTVAYAGVPSAPTDRRGLWLETHGTGDQVAPIMATMSQPAYAKYWWPCKDRPDDKIDHLTIRCTVPTGLLVAAPGLLVDQAETEPGWTTFTWVHTYPVATYLVSLAVSNYVLWGEDCTTPLGTSMPLQHFVYPQDEVDSRVDFGRTCEMVDLCEQWFGIYPFGDEKYGHAEFNWGGAMEHQTCTSFGRGFITGQGFAWNIVMHELAHQWFGNSLTPRTWSDIWLNEGLATYSEALWYEHEEGPTGYRRFLRLGRPASDWAGQGPVYNPVPVFPGRIIYDKGAWIIHMLRGRLDDDDRFLELLHDWAQGGGRPYGHVTTEEFIAHCEARFLQPLDGFFWPYLTTDRLPLLRWRHETRYGGAAPDTVRLSVEQTQPVLFDNIYPVDLVLDGGEVLRKRVHLAARTVAVDVILPPGAQLERVRLDPEGWVLWRPSAFAEEEVGIAGIYPNPAYITQSPVTFEYRLKATSTVSVAIYDVMGRCVYREPALRVAPNQGDVNRATWNGMTRTGGRAAAGVYWAALTVDGRRTVQKFTLIR